MQVLSFNPNPAKHFQVLEPEKRHKTPPQAVSVLQNLLLVIPCIQFGHLSTCHDFLTASSSLLVLWLSKEELN